MAHAPEVGKRRILTPKLRKKRHILIRHAVVTQAVDNYKQDIILHLALSPT